jgi:hypothetical protein
MIPRRCLDALRLLALSACFAALGSAQSITSLSPSAAIAGAPAFSLVVSGSGFTAASVIRWNGAPLKTKFVVESLLATLVPASFTDSAGIANITVTDGGKTSAPVPFTVFGEENTWTPVLDSQAVTFGQVNPLVPDSVVSDWQAGVVFVDQKRLRHEGITGYIQVLEFGASPQEANWVVQNYPVTGPNALAGNSAPYTFATPPSGPLASTLVAVVNTKRPVTPVPPNRPVVPPQRVTPQAHPIRLIPTNIGGVLIPPPPTAPELDKITPVDPDMKRTDNQDGLTEKDSVEQAKNECAPAAVANSMEYLKVDDKLKNVPSTGNQANSSRVGALGRAMNYNPALGTSALNILQGKKNYIQQKRLNLETESQGRFCPTASIDPRCPGGQNGSDGVTPTENFITKALKDKKDVELCFSWPAKPGSAGPPPTVASTPGAHCVFVTGYRFVNGFLRLDVVQDLDQGRMGGLGWEDGGHMSLTIGMSNNQLWIKNWFGQAAQVTHAITEAPK